MRLILLIYIVTCYCKYVTSLKHHLVLTNDYRYQVSVSSFGYNVGGRLNVIVQNLTLRPDPGEEFDKPQYGFALIKSDQARNPYAPRPYQHGITRTCQLDEKPYDYNQMTLSINHTKKVVEVRCTGKSDIFPMIETLDQNPDLILESNHGSYKHTSNKRAAGIPPSQKPSHDKLVECSRARDLPLEVYTDFAGQTKYSFNFTMSIRNEHEEGIYYLTFVNCRGFFGPSYVETHYEEIGSRTLTQFNLSVLVSETNYPMNYLSAGAMPLPQMYFVLSVMFFVIGCIWVNFTSRQAENTLKIHKLMTVLVFAKACSLLFHGINYHYIALDGQPVVTWAYLYYATRSVKGALFFITLTLIGSGWTFVKYILSPRDKQIILVIVALQVIAHIAEIILDESTEGEASIEFWAELCGLVDLFSCIVILLPITWSVRHLEEASRTDGKAAQNLKRMEIFKRFYVISTIYIYVTRIMTFVFLSSLVYKYSWLAELFSEMATLVYLVITGYYFQPMQTNPYLLLSTENDFEEDILFSVDGTQMDDMRNLHRDETRDTNNLLEDDDRTRKTKRVLEDLA